MIFVQVAGIFSYLREITQFLPLRGGHKKMPDMKFVTSLGTMAALAVALSGCSGSSGGGSVSISTTSANFAVAGNPYTSTLVAVGGSPPFTWAVVSGLPAWVSLNAATGVLTGNPTTSDVGNFNPIFRVTDSAGATGFGSVLLAVHNRTDILSVDNSTPPVPGNAVSSKPAISSDGRFVAFASSSNLISGVGGSQIYLHDWQTNQTSLVSRDSGTTINPGNGVSDTPSISADGRFVAFVSSSTNLVPGVSGQLIYLRDVQAGVTSLVSKDNFGNPASAGSKNTAPSISGDGRFIAFVSNATNFGTSGQQIYLHDTQVSGAFPNGQTILISKDNTTPTPIPGNGTSDTPSISNDECFIAFTSASSNLGAPPNQIFVRGPLAIPGCAGTEVTTLASKDNSGNPASAVGLTTINPSISGNGRFIAFVSNATNFGASGQQIYLHDTQVSGAFPNGQTILISKDTTTPTPIPGNFPSDSPSISIDGCFVAFTSQSTNLGAPANQILIRGPLAIGGCVGSEQTSLVSKDSAGNPANSVAGGTIDPSANGNGQFIAFSSTATNLVTPPPGNRQIYVRAMP